MKRFVLTIVLAAPAVGCAGRQTQPAIASSAEAASYAIHYPEDLTLEKDQLVADREQARSIVAALPDRAGEIRGSSDNELLLRVVEKSDQSGRAQAFADAHHEQRVVRTFWEDERGPISSRVSGSVQAKASESNCQGELTNAVPYALKDGVDKQLEKRLRASNEAQLLIERYKGALGPQNVRALQALADDIAVASYLVNVALLEERNRIQRLVSEKRDIDSTLERGIEEERSFQNQAGRNAQDRKASEERVNAMLKSRADLEGSVQAAEAEIKGLDEQVKQLKSDYDKALEALKERIKNRQLS